MSNKIKVLENGMISFDNGKEVLQARPDEIEKMIIRGNDQSIYEFTCGVQALGGEIELIFADKTKFISQFEGELCEGFKIVCDIHNAKKKPDCPKIPRTSTPGCIPQEWIGKKIVRIEPCFTDMMDYSYCEKDSSGKMTSGKNDYLIYLGTTDCGKGIKYTNPRSIYPNQVKTLSSVWNDGNWVLYGECE